ncbi:MAG: ribose 5-phosphate isomerase A [Candidatus Diapherotrites archaeon]
MGIEDSHIEDFVAKYIKGDFVVAVGTSLLGKAFLNKLAFAEAERGVNISIIPTSLETAAIASQLKLKIVSLNEVEIDVAIEFVDAVDDNYNFIKRNSSSLVRDKMIAQSAATLIVVTKHENYVKKLAGKIPFEIATFGYKRTLNQLNLLGKARLREINGKPYKTETNHYLADVDVDEIYSPEDLEYQSKEIPGVLETGLFLGYADKIILYDKNIEVKSRTEFKQ